MGHGETQIQTSKTDTVLGGGRNRPGLRIPAATGQFKMSFLRTAHASAVGIINIQPGQKFPCTQTAIRMVNDIW